MQNQFKLRIVSQLTLTNGDESMVYKDVTTATTYESDGSDFDIFKKLALLNMRMTSNRLEKFALPAKEASGDDERADSSAG